MSNSSDNYEDILNQSWDNIPVPKLLPEGSWLLRGQNAKYQPSKGEDQAPTVMFVDVPKEPMNDVDAEELAKLGDNYDLANNKLFTRVFINDASDWNKARKILKAHGIETEGQSIQDSLKAYKGTESIAFLSQRTFTNKAGEEQQSNEASQFTNPADAQS